MPDRYDAPDAVILTDVQNRVTYINANLAALGLVAGDVTALSTALTAAQTALNAHVAAQELAESRRQEKDDAIRNLAIADRALIARLQASPAVSDAERQAMNLTVRDRQPTPSAAPTTRPVGRVSTANRLRHEIAWSDSATPDSRAKPDGVMGCDIYYKIGGAAPLDPSECVYLTTDTRSPYVVEYDGVDAGKTVHYLLRWVSTRGEKGPWSETVSATVAG